MARKLRPPPSIRSTADLLTWAIDVGKWLYELFRQLGDSGAIGWDSVDKTGSNVTDLSSHSHGDLTGILPADTGSSTTAADKHVSNLQTKNWEDHRNASSEVHGIFGSVVGTTDEQTLTNKTIDGDSNTLQDVSVSSLKTVAGDADKVLRRNSSGEVISGNAVPNASEVTTIDASQVLSNKRMDSTNKYGGTTHYTTFEADGTMQAIGDATCWDDSQVPAFDARNAAASLTLAALSGTLYNPRFDLNDEIFGSIQLSHRMKTTGTVVIKPHIHLINKNAIGATNYNVKFEFDWAWSNINGTALGTVTSDPQNFSFQNASALTHKLFSFTDITAGTGQGGISSYFLFRLKRIAAATEPYNTNDIFFAGFDLHFETDMLGSRDPGSK